MNGYSLKWFKLIKQRDSVTVAHLAAVSGLGWTFYESLLIVR